METLKDPQALVAWGVAKQAMTRGEASGDRHLVAPFEGGVLVAVVDGLGHGPKASAVALEAVAALRELAGAPVLEVVEHCHRALRGSRGVVMSLASFEAEARTLTWLGVGNVKGVLLSGNGSGTLQRSQLMLRGGIVGYRVPSLRPSTHALAPGDMLVFATDGIRSAFVEALPRAGEPQQVADHVFDRYHRGTDDALVLVARYGEGTR